MNIQELVREIDFIETILKEPVDHFDPEAVLAKGNRLTTVLPNCTKVCSELEKIISILTWDFIQENGLNVKGAHTELVRESMIDEHVSELKSQLRRAEGYSKAIYSTLEWLRSNISFLKGEQKQLGING
jgi:hypothetical protein